LGVPRRVALPGRVAAASRMTCRATAATRGDRGAAATRASSSAARCAASTSRSETTAPRRGPSAARPRAGTASSPDDHAAGTARSNRGHVSTSRGVTAGPAAPTTARHRPATGRFASGAPIDGRPAVISTRPTARKCRQQQRHEQAQACKTCAQRSESMGRNRVHVLVAVVLRRRSDRRFDTDRRDPRSCSGGNPLRPSSECQWPPFARELLHEGRRPGPNTRYRRAREGCNET
jgi:hypothetical protein